MTIKSGKRMNEQEDKYRSKKRYYLFMEVGMGLVIVGLLYLVLRVLIGF